MKWLFAGVALLYALLLIASIGGLWWQAPAEAGTASRLIMAGTIYLPLLICGLGVLLRDARLLTWLCFILLFYFCGYVTQAMEPDLRLLALVRVLLVTLLFILTLVYIRALKQHHISLRHQNGNLS